MAPVNAEESYWTALVVDDDSMFLDTVTFALNDMNIQDRPLNILLAHSMVEASRIIASRPEIAVILLDIVMETDDAGFRLIKAIREVLGNSTVRIVILTGQPGFSSMQQSLDKFDINDYWTKGDLTSERLKAIMKTGVRSFSQIQTIEHARKGLQLIAESSGALAASHSLQEFSVRMIVEIAGLLGVPPEGLLCAALNDNVIRIVGAAGKYSGSIQGTIEELKEPALVEELKRALEKKESIFSGEFTVIYFPRSLAGDDYAAFIATGRPLSSTDIELLRVFTENIGKGLYNISLFSTLDRLAYEDPLVHLPNANALVRAIEEHRDDKDYSLMLVDLDRFAEMNLSLGVDYGDIVLKEFAASLRSGVDPSILVSRIRDDLFALLGPTDRIMNENIEARLAEWTIPHGETVIRAGTLLYHLGSKDREAMQIITAARMALRQSKRKGMSQHSVYDPAIQDSTKKRYMMLQSLIRALHDGEISIALQPQFDLKTGKPVGAELLARWTNKEGESISPGEFIPLAEATGLILELGNRVIELTFEAIAKIIKIYNKPLRIGFNVSMIQLMQPDFVGQLLQKIRTANLGQIQMEVEVTESVAMQNFEIIEKVLSALKNEGVEIAIDDFGTGFSSLARLKRLPAHRLKIDRAFVEQIGTTHDKLSIADMIIRLAQRLGMETIAEGIETETQREWLQEQGCKEGQGYLLARPMPLDSFIKMLNEMYA